MGTAPIDLNDPNAVGSFGAVGYRWDNVFSTEIEGGLRARSFDGAAEAETGRGGQEATKVLMVNARFAPTTSGAANDAAIRQSIFTGFENKVSS